MLDTGQVIHYKNYDILHIRNILHCTKYHFFVCSLFSRKRYQKGYTISPKTMDYNMYYSYYNRAMYHCLDQLYVLS